MSRQPLVLPADPSSPALARRLVRTACHRHSVPHDVENRIVLVTGEIVTTALHRSPGRYVRLRVSVTGERIKVILDEQVGPTRPSDAVDRRAWDMVCRNATGYGYRVDGTHRATWACVAMVGRRMR